MKIAVECHSPLLQKSLELFLKDHLSTKKNADVTLSDKKHQDNFKRIYISSEKTADLVKPFSKAELYLTLESYFNSDENNNQLNIVKDTKEVHDINNLLNKKKPTTFIELEQQIITLTQNYQNQLIQTIRDYHEKK
jgi:uncharacterized protein YnzC (UPF0291/DUF896 family)